MKILESLDELEEMVIKMFSQIKNKNVTAKVWNEPAYNAEDHYKKVWYIVPVSDMRKLNLIFPASYYTPFYRAEVK